MQNEDMDILLSKKIVLDERGIPPLTQALRIAVYDEYRAYETYNAVVSTFDAGTPFTNIMQSELRHFQSLIELCEKYEVPVPINDLKNQITLPKTLHECYELGVAAELSNVAMYDHLLMYVQDYPDVQDAFFKFQAASYNNHVPAFREKVSGSSVEGDELMSKINDFAGKVSKIASGEADPQEIAGLFSQTNISLLTGILTGGVGGVALNQFFKKNDEEK